MSKTSPKALDYRTKQYFEKPYVTHPLIISLLFPARCTALRWRNYRADGVSVQSNTEMGAALRQILKNKIKRHGRVKDCGHKKKRIDVVWYFRLSRIVKSYKNRFRRVSSSYSQEKTKQWTVGPADYCLLQRGTFLILFDDSRQQNLHSQSLV